MRVRALRGFVLGPGKEVRKGDVFELDERVVRHGGAVVRMGHALPRSFYEPVMDELPAPPEIETETRDAEPQHRDPDVQNRDPRPRRFRRSEGEGA